MLRSRLFLPQILGAYSTCSEMSDTKEIVLNQEQLRNDLKNSKYNNLLNNAMLETQLKAYIIMRYIQDDIEKYIESKKKLLFSREGK